MTQRPSRRLFDLPRHPAGARILGAVVAFALTGWFNTMIYNFRVVGTAHAIGIAAGIVLMALWLAIVVHRVLTASPPAWLREMLSDGEIMIGFVVFELIVLNILSPFFLPLSQIWPGGSIPLLVLGFAGRLSGPVLFVTFVVLMTALVWLILVRLIRRLVPAGVAVARVQRMFRVAAVSAVALYGIYATVLSFNGCLDGSIAVEHRRELVAVTRIEALVSWFDLRAADGTMERITWLPRKDSLWPGYVDPGQAIVVSVRSGAFGIPWVERVAHDADRQAELMVAAAPSAAAPRRTLITAYVREGRGREAIEHTRAYLGYYPRDVAFAGTVAATLRSAGDVPSALAVEQLVREIQSGG